MARDAAALELGTEAQHGSLSFRMNNDELTSAGLEAPDDDTELPDL
jgi:hypothetical protein